MIFQNFMFYFSHLFCCWNHTSKFAISQRFRFYVFFLLFRLVYVWLKIALLNFSLANLHNNQWTHFPSWLFYYIRIDRSFVFLLSQHNVLFLRVFVWRFFFVCLFLSFKEFVFFHFPWAFSFLRFLIFNICWLCCYFYFVFGWLK